MSFPLIFLIGLPASGKTTLGEAIRARLAVSFTDLDAAIEKCEGCSVSEIFSRFGEKRFREIESEILREITHLHKKGGGIIACGGGTPCHSSNVEFMKANGRVVLLEAERNIVLRRLLEAPKGQRPVVRDSEGELETLARKIDSLAHARAPFYSLADIRFDSSRLDTPREIEETVTKFISEICAPNPAIR